MRAKRPMARISQDMSSVSTGSQQDAVSVLVVLPFALGHQRVADLWVVLALPERQRGIMFEPRVKLVKSLGISEGRLF